MPDKEVGKAIERVGEPLKKVGASLVVGGGIAGMQAALDLAESGIKVYMVDKKPAIGGPWLSWTRPSPPTTAPCALWPQGWLIAAGTPISKN